MASRRQQKLPRQLNPSILRMLLAVNLINGMPTFVITTHYGPSGSIGCLYKRKQPKAGIYPSIKDAGGADNTDFAEMPNPHP